jgi:iodotyrosine deiodinase
MTGAKYVPLDSYREFPVEEMRRRAAEFRAEMQRRRSVRHFSDRAVPRDVIEQCLLAAGSAPSGANRQPWRFVVVADPDVKRRIRGAAERAEHEFYAGAAGAEWLDALAPLGTNERKPFLEVAPHLIAIFAQKHGVAADGSKVPHYFVRESVGIATGLLLAAIHHAGLAALTYTPPRAAFLNEILARPDNERPFLILVVGYPAENATVPNLKKKPLNQIAEFV